MTSLSSSAAESSAPSVLDLRAVGFTEGQATAIRAAIKATTTDAIDAVRDDLMRWHLYIALYLLVQIGIALLASLMLQNIQDRFNAFHVSCNDVGARTLRARDDDISLLSSYPRPSVDRATLNRKGRLELGFEGLASSSGSDQEVAESLETQRGTVYQDSMGFFRAIDSDSTLNSHAHTSESAATSERHHAPRLVCRRQRPESECVLIRPLERCLTFRPQREFARSGEIYPTTHLPEWRLP